MLNKESIVSNFTTTVEKVEILLKYYNENSFDLIKLEPKTKVSYEEGWQNQEHKDINEWEDWLNDGSNIGLKTGKVSGVTVLDIDQLTIPIEISHLIGEPVIQKTRKGYHLFYRYEPDLPDHDYMKDGKKIIELRNSSGRQVVIAPSFVDDTKRAFIDLKPITKMPDELKKWLLDNINQKTVIIDNKPVIFNKDTIGQLSNGNRNQGLTRLAGYVRSLCNFEQTSKIINKLNDDGIITPPLYQTEVNNILRSLNRYNDKDVFSLAMKIYDYLEKAEEANERDIADVLKEDRKDIIIALDYLIKEEYIVKSNRLYKFKHKVIWNDSIPDDFFKPIDFKMPYFNDKMTFSYSDLLIFLASSGSGKTHFCGNIVKRLVDQGVTPYVITTEAGSRIKKIFDQLGIKSGQYRWAYIGDPLSIELPYNSVIVLDWLSLAGMYAEADKIFANLSRQLTKTQSILICFMQLKKAEGYNKNESDKNTRLSYQLPAKNLLDQYASFVVLHEYVKNDKTGSNRTYSKWQPFKIRDIIGDDSWTDVIVKYDKDTKLINTLDEIGESLENETRRIDF